jgi:integrase
MNEVSILARQEIETVIKDLRRKISKGRINPRVNMVLFRLATCCGLRRQEIVGINMADVVLDTPRPTIAIRKEISKGRKGSKKGRLVPLWWDKGTQLDLRAWRDKRVKDGAKPDDPFLPNPIGRSKGKRMLLCTANRRWRIAIKVLGEVRVNQVHLHAGRHSFISHALHLGRSLPEVMRAVGHRNLATTSIYAHTLEREDVADLFAF